MRVPLQPKRYHPLKLGVTDMIDPFAYLDKQTVAI